MATDTVSPKDPIPKTSHLHCIMGCKDVAQAGTDSRLCRQYRVKCTWCTDVHKIRWERKLQLSEGSDIDTTQLLR